MSSVREQILERIQTLLSSVPGVVQTYRERMAALSRGESPAILIQPEEEVVEARAGPQMGGGVVVRNLTVLVTLIVRAEVPSQTADALVVAIHAAIMSDPTLGGLVARVLEQSTKWDFELADETALAAEIRYGYRYQTRATDLTSST